MKTILAHAACRNCGKPATDRKQQYCSQRCRVLLKRRRAEWDRQRAAGELQISRITHLEVIRSVGGEDVPESHAISDPPTSFDRWALEQLRAEVITGLGPRPGKR